MKTKKQIRQSILCKKIGNVYYYSSTLGYNSDSAGGRMLKELGYGKSDYIGDAYNKKEFINAIYNHENNI